MRFEGKRVVVTGACGVFGSWIAAAFAREGATLCLSDRRGDAHMLAHRTPTNGQFAVAGRGWRRT